MPRSQKALSRPCFSPQKILLNLGWRSCQRHGNSVLLSARYHGVCYYNICMWNSWWLRFLSVWQSAWAPNSEWQGLAVNANGTEQLTEKRIIISFHYIYTACLFYSVSFPWPMCEQQSELAAIYLLFFFFFEVDKHSLVWIHDCTGIFGISHT